MSRNSRLPDSGRRGRAGGVLPIVAGLLIAAAALAVAKDHSNADRANPWIKSVPAVKPPMVTSIGPALPLLWKVSDDDNAIYLLGSFHLLKPGDYPTSPDIDAAFDASDRIVFEVTPEQLDDPANAQRFLAAAGYGDDRTLSGVLPARLRTSLEQLMVARGGSIASLNGYEPWFVNLSLVLGLAQSMGFSADHGLDRHLMARAAAEGKQTAGLESMEVQLLALDASPMPEQIIGLADFLDSPEAMPAMIDGLHQAWRSADVSRLEAITRAEMEQRTPGTYQAVNVARNDAWMPKLQAMLDEERADALVVVGALHLLGRDGVVERLRAKGFNVERVCSACDDTPVATQ